MKTENKKPIRENRKDRLIYGIGSTAGMLISLGGIFLAKTGHGGAQLFPDSLQSLSLLSIIGWAAGVCGAMAAVSIARRSKGIFVLTREKVEFKGIADKESWSVSGNLIRDCSPVNSWFYGMMGLSMIQLTVENKEGCEKTFRIGPFSGKTIEGWIKDLKMISGNAVEERTTIKRRDNRNGRLLDPLNKTV